MPDTIREHNFSYFYNNTKPKKKRKKKGAILEAKTYKG